MGIDKEGIRIGNEGSGIGKRNIVTTHQHTLKINGSRI